MRLVILIQTLLFALVFAALGVWAFVKIGRDQRQLDFKFSQVHAGQAQAQTLTAVRKYFNTGRHGAVYYHVVFHNAANAQVNESVNQSFYDATKVGDHSTAYAFADGYFLPQAITPAGRDATLARWFFLL